MTTSLDSFISMPAPAKAQHVKSVHGGQSVWVIYLGVPKLKEGMLVNAKAPKQYNVLPLTTATLLPKPVRAKKPEVEGDDEIANLAEGRVNDDEKPESAVITTQITQSLATYELKPFERDERMKAFANNNVGDKNMKEGCIYELCQCTFDTYTGDDGKMKVFIWPTKVIASTKTYDDLFANAVIPTLNLARDFRTGEAYPVEDQVYDKLMIPIENDMEAFKAIGGKDKAWIGKLLLDEKLVEAQFSRSGKDGGEEMMAFHDGVDAAGIPASPRVAVFYKTEDKTLALLILYGGYSNDWKALQLPLADWKFLGKVLLPVAKGVLVGYVDRKRTGALQAPPAGYQATASLFSNLFLDAPTMIERAGIEIPADAIEQFTGETTNLRAPEVCAPAIGLINLGATDGDVTLIVNAVQEAKAKAFILADIADAAKIKALPIEERAAAITAAQGEDPHYTVYVMSPGMDFVPMIRKANPAKKKPKPTTAA